MSRGIKASRDRFVEGLANMYFPIKLKNEKGEEITEAVQGLLQPIELWSFVFPEENLHNVLRTLEPKTAMGHNNKFGFAPPKNKLGLAALRKALKFKKIPKWEPVGPKFPLYKDNMDIIGLGIKEDYKNELGNECL